jgi:hypothetical protein
VRLDEALITRCDEVLVLADEAELVAQLPRHALYEGELVLCDLSPAAHVHGE